MNLRRVQRSMRKTRRLCLGLMSGTSADGIDAALCDIAGTGPRARVRLVASAHARFRPELRRRILEARELAEISKLNFELGERFAAAALRLMERAKVSAAELDIIGSHGQTVAHLPTDRPASTLQIGESSVIAERTGVPTLSDFRTRDVAAGGEGAPLVPYGDWVLFRLPGHRRALQNLGGIANVTVVGDALADTLAFDTGPGNMLLDALATRATGGTLDCDRDGRLSARGRVIEPLLSELLDHPFLRRPPPRSTGREEFGESLSAPLWRRFHRRPFDLVATAAAFTVEATARAYERWVLRAGALEGVYVSGGGSRNPTLMRGLARRLSPTPVHRLDALGFPEGAKEAACFALLASEWLAGTAQSVPSATGARHPTILGKLVL